MTHCTRQFSCSGSGGALRCVVPVLFVLLLLGLTAGVGAQNPTGTSPNTPTPYSWPTFHAGGTSAGPLVPPLTVPGPSALFGQMQGTPTGLFTTPGTAGYPAASGTYETEIASFLLGNYNPTSPPAGSATIAPNHFGDNILSVPPSINEIFSPFGFINPILLGGSGAVASQDNPAAAYTPSVAAWQSAGPTPPAGDIVDTTATGSEYRRTLVSTGAATATATWTLTVPAGQGGQYSVYLNLPNPAAPTDPTTGIANPNYPENRIPDAHYVVSSGGTTLFDGHITQTEANSPQYLAGPFTLTAGQVVTVALDNTTQTTPASPTTTYVLADSVSLQSGSVGSAGVNDVQGSPVAVNVTEYPEIADALYYGVDALTPDPAVTTGPPLFDQPDPVPHGNVTIGAPDITTSGRQHAIRQLVYFGRAETIVLTDPTTGGLVDQNGNTTTTPVTQPVGAIYCMDGNTGGVVWRYQTPNVLNADGVTHSAGSRAVFSTPAVARIHVLIAPGLYATKLVVIVGDDRGFVYCLDALGNRDGTCNITSVNTIYNQPYFDTAHPHAGTTNAYWVYRPDPNRPKDITSNKVVAPEQHPDGTGDLTPITSQLPVPGSFGLASPTIYISQRLDTDGTTPPNGVGDAAHGTSAATVYIGNSNGTLYKLDTLGVALAATDLYPAIGATPAGDAFNASLDIRYKPTAAYPIVPTCTVNWWLPVNGANTNRLNAPGNVSITSAPAVLVAQPPNAAGQVGLATPNPVAIFFTTTNHATNQNEGRLYRVDGAGPVDPTSLVNAPLLPVGGPGYNSNAQGAWSFPNGYARSGGTTQTIRAPLGNIDGSPVIFTNTDVLPAGTAPITRLYVAANDAVDASGTTLAAGDAGHIWAVNTDGTAAWAYPDAFDPNLTAPTTTLNGASAAANPLSGFQNATPAIGIVGFSKLIEYGTVTGYPHTDAFHAGGVVGQQVPMLYVGTVNGSNGVPGARFYGIDLDGANDADRTIFTDTTFDAAALGTGAAADTYSIAHAGIISNGSFTSSPALVVNTTNTGGAAPGNGGAVFISESDHTLHQINATPQSNNTDPLVSNPTTPDFGDLQIFSTAGPYSSPAVAAFNAADVNGAGGTVSVIDWVYFGDSSTGLCVGLSPKDINFGTNGGFGAAGPSEPPGGYRFSPPQFPLRTYLMPTAKASSTNMNDAYQIGQPMPAFEWGDSVYIRINDAVPPNPTGDPALGTDDPNYRVVLDSTDTSVYATNGSAITLQISEVDTLGNLVATSGADIGQVPNVLVPSLPANGFIADTSTGPEAAKRVLKDTTGRYWLGAYTYSIGDGRARKNTPGARRRIISATQTAPVYKDLGSGIGAARYQSLGTLTLTATINNGNGYNDPVTHTRKYFTPVDQPTFAILNPLALNGSAVPLPLSAASASAGPQFLGTANINSGLGPFGAVAAAPGLPNLPAFSNGNRVYQSAADLPKNGVVGGAVPLAKPLVTRTVITATPEIPHGTSGSNTDANGNPLLAVANRSVIGLGSDTRTVQVSSRPMSLQWNDNAVSGGAKTNGPGARINAIAWDDVPTAYGAGSNTSLDYPDIGPRAVQQFLQSPVAGTQSITNHAAPLDAPTGSAATPATRAVKTDSVQVNISVPRYQPANLQLMEQTGTGAVPIVPANAIAGANDFPMGYIAQMRLFVNSNNNGRYDDGEAYRDTQVYTGVPVDMSTQIANRTVDLGKLPQSFGVQTQPYALIGSFTPYNPNYQQFFKQLNVQNTGNVNLLNIHFDQKIDAGGGTFTPLPLLSGPLDALSGISAYDTAGVTGPRTLTLPGTGVSEEPFLLRTNVDTDTIAAYGHNPGLTTTTATFHKARVGDSSPTTLTVPDVPHDNNAGNPALTPYFLPSAATPTIGKTAPPFVGLAVPLGTPVGTYAQNVRLFEGLSGAYNPLVGPAYGTFPDTFNYATQPYSSPVVVKATVTEARVTDGSVAGSLPQVDNAAQNATGTADFLPSAFRNAFWNGGTLSGNGSLNLYWTTARGNTAPGTLPASTPPYNLVGANLPFTGNYFDAGKTGVGGDARGYWWKLPAITGANPLGLLMTNTLATGVFSGLTVAPDQQVFNGTDFSSDGTAYAFVPGIQPISNTQAYQSIINCYPLGANGTLGAAVSVTSDLAQAKYGVRGLKFSGTTFTDPLDTTKTLSNNLWAFWYGGPRGRSVIYYSSANTRAASLIFNSVTPTGGSPQTGPPLALPLPAGLSSASDPCAVLTSAPDALTATAGNAVPVIEVSYTGIAPDGNSDIYVSRYRPYTLKAATGTGTQVGLALTPTATISEFLQPDAAGQFWQARDAAWVRNASLDVNVAGASLGLPAKTPVYDKASGLLIYDRGAVYVDLARGRVRFGKPLAAGTVVYATFQSQARRITTDPRADSAPIAFIDEAFKPNEASFKANLGRVQTARYWFLWRKSGSAGTATAPTLFSKTQRLTVVLPNSIGLDAAGKPQVDVTDASGTLYARASGGVVDVDWSRGRLYFPLKFGTKAMEGDTVTVTGTDASGANFTVNNAVVHWLDEPRLNDSGTQPTGSIFAATDTSERAVPIDTSVNEGSVSAFLDPLAYADIGAGAYDPAGAAGTNHPDQPHKLWLFWNSTRNGTADLYYETIEPRFSVSVAGP